MSNHDLVQAILIIQDNKRDLEKQLGDLLNEFVNRNGVRIESLQLIRDISGHCTVLVEVSI